MRSKRTSFYSDTVILYRIHWKVFSLSWREKGGRRENDEPCVYITDSEVVGRTWCSNFQWTSLASPLRSSSKYLDNVVRTGRTETLKQQQQIVLFYFKTQNRWHLTPKTNERQCELGFTMSNVSCLQIPMSKSLVWRPECEVKTVDGWSTQTLWVYWRNEDKGVLLLPLFLRMEYPDNVPNLLDCLLLYYVNLLSFVVQDTCQGPYRSRVIHTWK